MTEPILNIRAIKDPDACRVYVEQDETCPSRWVISAPRKLEWWEMVEAVTSTLELRERKGRDD